MKIEEIIGIFLLLRRLRNPEEKGRKNTKLFRDKVEKMRTNTHRHTNRKKRDNICSIQ